MTGRTHDVAAFASLITVMALVPELPQMSLMTAVVAFGANFVGGLFPDIDQKTSDFWDNFRLGPVFANVVCKFLGGHRNFSHSLVGTVFFGVVWYWLLHFIRSLILIDVNPDVVWMAFMIGYISHLLFDMPTKAGIPLLWPVNWDFGIPPFQFLRIQSGKFIEKWIVFPSLFVAIGIILYTHQTKFLLFLQSYIK